MSIEPVSEIAASSAMPTTSAPTRTRTIVAAGLKPSTNGAAIRAMPIASSMAPWAAREMSRNAVIATDRVLVDWPIDCEVEHTDRRPLRFRAVATRVRLDALLAERGLFASRSRAAASVLAGEVRLGSDGQRASKPGQLVDPEVVLSVDERPAFVSRGGVKLVNALEALGFDVSGRRCLDVGASTGGFTDALLQRGAAHVVAGDGGYRELAGSPRHDARVTVVERVNARSLRCEQLPYRPDLVVCDVSFISLTKVLGAVLACCAERFDVLALVKPQFEVGRERVGKGGVVRSADDRRAALVP